MKELKDKLNKIISEGHLGELADVAERDHEVQMARADLYKIAKYAINLHSMLKNVSEAEGIEGWQQAKITKAADYMSSVFHSLDYDMRTVEPEELPDPLAMEESKAKPDYIDLDGDGDKKETMKKAAADKKKKGSVKERKFSDWSKK
tara:strand:+ start:166 stop:606 length:441 start_codon:yes stop_codon:yes gene_type:complete